MRAAVSLLAIAATVSSSPLRAQEATAREVLRGSVVDAAGAPVAGAIVEVHRRDAQGFTCLDLTLFRSTRLVQKLRTGRNGSFAAQLPRGVPFELHLDDGTHAPLRRCEVYAGEEVRLQLVEPARLALQLTDEDGKPAPGGSLVGWDGNHVPLLDGTIDEQGRWLSGRLAPGAATLDIGSAAARRPEWQDVDLVAGRTTPIDLELAPGCVLRGRVTDLATGAPIAGALVGEGWTMGKWVATDAEGRYEMRGYGAGYFQIRVTAAGHAPEMRNVAPGAGDLVEDVALDPGCAVTGRIVDAQRRPVAGVYVAAVGRGAFHEWSGVRTDADGRYRLDGLHAAFAHSLFVRADAAATLVGDLPALGSEPLALPDVALRAARYVSGTATVDDKPASGILVELRGANADRSTLLGVSAGGATGLDYCIATRSMTTDSLGRIHFADVPPGTYVLAFADSQGATVTVEVGDRDPPPVRLEH